MIAVFYQRLPYLKTQVSFEDERGITKPIELRCQYYPPEPTIPISKGVNPLKVQVKQERAEEGILFSIRIAFKNFFQFPTHFLGGSGGSFFQIPKCISLHFEFPGMGIQAVVDIPMKAFQLDN